jgi:hypothetical protein
MLIKYDNDHLNNERVKGELFEMRKHQSMQYLAKAGADILSNETESNLKRLSPDERKELKELLDTQYAVERSSTKHNLPGLSSLIVDPLTKQNKANSKQILFDKLKI